MSYQIIVEFPDKRTAEKFMVGLMDGGGENLCDFTWWRQLPGTDGSEEEHFERAVGSAPEGTPLCFCSKVWDQEEEGE